MSITFHAYQGKNLGKKHVWILTLIKKIFRKKFLTIFQNFFKIAKKPPVASYSFPAAIQLLAGPHSGAAENAFTNLTPSLVNFSNIGVFSGSP